MEFSRVLIKNEQGISCHTFGPVGRIRLFLGQSCERLAYIYVRPGVVLAKDPRSMILVTVLGTSASRRPFRPAAAGNEEEHYVTEGRGIGEAPRAWSSAQMENMVSCERAERQRNGPGRNGTKTMLEYCTGPDDSESGPVLEENEATGQPSCRVSIPWSCCKISSDDEGRLRGG